jgi:hypothetical protein
MYEQALVPADECVEERGLEVGVGRLVAERRNEDEAMRSVKCDGVGL